MAQSDGDIVSILIQLGVVGQKDVAAAKDLIKETGATGKQAMADMNGGMPENLAGWAKYKKNVEEAGGSVEGLHASLGKLRGVTKMAGPEFAELGHLLHAATNPAAITTAALVAGMEAYFKWVERAQEKHREMGEDIQKINNYMHDMVSILPKASETWVTVTKTVAEAKAQMASLGEEMKRFEDRAKVFDLAAVDAQKARIDGRERELTLLEEQLKLLAQIGAITKEDADLRGGKIEHAKKLNEITAEVATRQTALTQAENNKAEELKRIPGGTAAFSPEAIGAAQKRAIDAAGRFAQASKFANGEGDKELEEIGKQIIANKHQWKAHGAEYDPSTGQLMGVAYREQEEQLKSRRAAISKNVANAKAELPQLAQESSAADVALRDMQGMREKFTAMDQQIAILRQQLIDAKAEAPKKTAEENQRFALDQFGRVLKDSGLNPNEIITQGALSMDDIRRMINQGYTPGRIQSEGETALREKSLGQRYDESAIRRLEEFNADLRSRDRLHALLNSLGENSALLIKTIQQHTVGATNQKQEIMALQAQYSAIIRALPKFIPAN